MYNLFIIIITGLSGSGKSTAIAALEDAGFYCVDNMPVALLPKFLELPVEKSYEVAGLGFVMDLREKGFLTEYPPVFEALRQKGYHFKIIFLEADEETLIQRYSQTRRHHPLSRDKNLLEGIRAEKEQLAPLRDLANHVINTSAYTVHELKAAIREISEKGRKRPTLQINMISFGYKFGTPRHADLMIDVRFLANPYFIPHLKELSGTDEAVKNYVFNDKKCRPFLKKYLGLLDYLIPLYEKEGKAYLTIGVGCTGGRHRSVVIAEAIYKHIRKAVRRVDITHRDIGEPQ